MEKTKSEKILKEISETLFLHSIWHIVYKYDSNLINVDLPDHLITIIIKDGIVKLESNVEVNNQIKKVEQILKGFL